MPLLSCFVCLNNIFINPLRISYSIFDHLHFPLSILPRSVPHYPTHLPSWPPFLFFKTHCVQILFCPNTLLPKYSWVWGCLLEHGQPTGSHTPLKKADFSSLSHYHELIDSQLAVILHGHLSPRGWDLVRIESCACCLNSCECVCARTLLCPENSLTVVIPCFPPHLSKRSLTEPWANAVLVFKRGEERKRRREERKRGEERKRRGEEEERRKRN